MGEADVGTVEVFEAFEEMEGALLFVAGLEGAVLEAALGAVALVGFEAGFGDEGP